MKTTNLSSPVSRPSWSVLPEVLSTRSGVMASWKAASAPCRKMNFSTQQRVQHFNQQIGMLLQRTGGLSSSLHKETTSKEQYDSQYTSDRA